MANPRTKSEWDARHPHWGHCYVCSKDWPRRMKRVPGVCPNPSCHSPNFYKGKKVKR
jgi:hypothetical protein